MAHQFQPYSFDIVQDNEIIFDMILGMAFCKLWFFLLQVMDLTN